jgi:hypothetical protein
MTHIKFGKSKKPAQGDRVFLVNSSKDLKNSDFNKDELEYIERQEKASKKLIVINHLKHFSYIQLAEAKKTNSLTLEALRVAGNSLTAACNGQKISKIQLINLSGNSQYLMALAEGMALGNYQFLK